MGQVAGPLAGVTSMAAMGFTAEGDELKAQGVSAGDTYQAETLDRAAEYGDLKATQTSGQLTRQLSTTLGNIDAVRAAAHDDPTSPTGGAVRDYAETVGTEKKNIQVDSILAQSQEDTSNAAYLRTASSNALLGGNIAASADLLNGLAGALKSIPNIPLPVPS